MRQSWFSRAQDKSTGPTRRRRARRARVINLSIGAGLALLLGACAGQSGTTAVLANPRPIASKIEHKAAEAPKQRWGNAAGLNPVADGPHNTYRPESQRSRYPVIKAPALPANSAEVVAAPPATKVAGFNAGTSREVTGARAAHQRTYDNADGTQTTEFSAAALNYRKADGTWATIDSKLTGNAASGWRRAADSVDLQLAGRADAAELVRATLPGGGVLAYGAAEARPVTGAVTGDTATYRGVWPGVDIELQAQPGAMKETLVLASAGARRTFVFPLRLTGLKATMDGDRVVLTDPAGARRATIPAGYMVDADGDVSHQVGYKLITHSGAPALQVSADAKWLTAAGRSFPVKLDPPVLAEGGASESLVVQGDSSHGGGSDLLVGRRDGKSSASYLKFPNLVSQLTNHTIFSAQLSFAAYQAPSCKPRQLSVHPVTQSWSNGATNQSYPGPSVGGAIASSSFAQGYVGVGQASSACPVTGTVLNLGAKGRDLVQGWVNGSKPNNGLSLRAPVSDESAWKVIAGTGTANPPKLYVTHTPYNAKYAVPDPTPKPAVLQNQGGKVKVTVTNTSAMDWSVSGYRLIYRVYNARTNAKVGQYVAASLPAALARNRSVTLDASIRALPIGEYLLDFSMATANGKVVFTDENVPPARIALRVDNIAPVIGDLFPPNGYQSPTLTPQLWAQATDLDAPPKTTLQYKFEYCSIGTDGKPTGCTMTAYQTKQAFTVPAAKLKWSTTYLWRAFVKDNADEVSTDYATLITAVPQPEITSRIANAPYGSQDRDFDPDIGNFSTGAVDATIATAGPPLKVVRTYNSLDPRTDLAFGTGWMSQFDMKAAADADGSGNILITYPDGQQVRFGKNADNTYAAPLGRNAALSWDSTVGLFNLKDSAGTIYQFAGAPSGRLVRIQDKFSRTVEFSVDQTNGKLAKMQAKLAQSSLPGRALTFGWNSTGTHITSVSTDAVNGRKLTWTYAYDGDKLTTVCSPGTVSCSTYSYADGSHYRSGVLDSGPDSYWRFGEKKDAAAAGSEILNNLGKDAGVARNVTFEEAGGLAGTDNTAALFNGNTSVVELPRGIVKRSHDTAVETWFKVSGTQTGGPLLGYQDKAIDQTPTTGVPLLYIDTSGQLRGQFKTTSATPNPMTVNTDLRNNQWHHVVMSVSGDVQTLYLDGERKLSKPVADGVLDHSLLTFNQAGAAWATSPTSWPGWGSTAKRTFNGWLDETAVYGHALSDQSVKAHYKLGKNKADQVAVVTMPSGKIASEAVYDTSADRIKEYTDGNGGTWKIGLPTVFGGDTDLRRGVQVQDPADRPYLYEYDALTGRMLRSGSPIGISTRPEDRPPTPSPTPSPSPTEICNSPDPGDPQFCTTIPGGAGGPVFTEAELAGMVVRSFGYDAQGRQNLIVNENGDSVTLTFDDRGNVTSRKTCRKQGDCQTSYTKYTTPSATNPFDPRNDLPTEVRDPRSASATDTDYRTLTGYSAAGEVTSETGPDANSTKTDFSTGGEVSFNPSGEFVPSGLPLTVTDTQGRITRFKYNSSGDLTSVTTPSGLVTESAYDVLGRKIQDKEKSDSYPDGVVTTYTYDDMGRVLTTTGPATTNAVDGIKHQALTANTYDVDGNVVKTVVKDVLDANEPERVTTIEYDEFNHQVRTINPMGDEQSEGYDQFGNRTSVVDGNGNHYEYAFTARNDLAEVRLYDWRGDPDGGKPQDEKLGYIVLNSYAYDWGGRMAAQVDAMGRRMEYTYLGDDLLAKIVLKNFRNPDGTKRDIVVQENQYDAAGNLTRQATNNGLKVVTNAINNLGRNDSTTFDPGGLNRSTAFTYDSLGNVTSTVQTGNYSNVPWPWQAGTKLQTSNVYNAKGRLEREQVIDGSRVRTTSYTYDSRGLVLTTTDPRGNASGADKAAFTTTYKYDENGDRVQSIAPRVQVESTGAAATPANPTVTTGYNAFGEVVATRDALGNVARSKYDRMGRVVEATGPMYTPAGAPSSGASPITKSSYDALGNVVEKTDARGNVTRVKYDRLNRVVEQDSPGSTNEERAVTRYTYTRTGKLLSTVSPTGIRAEATYDDLDRPVTATKFERKPLTNTFTTTMKYDDANNVIEVRSPGNLVTTMTYNKIGDLLTKTDPALVTTRYGYDAFGNTVRDTDGAGRTTRRDYDGFGQVTIESDLDPSYTALRRESFTYDENGNVLTRTNALNKTVSFSYDPLDRLIQQVEPKSATEKITTSFGYDASGNRTRYTDGRGLSTFYSVNSLGLPETVIEPSTTAHPALGDRSWTVGYDLNGNAERLTAPGGVVRARTFDAANRLIAETGSGAGTTISRGTTYDLENRVKVVTAGTNANSYDYDDRGNLLSAAGQSGNASFAYDAEGQVTTRTDGVGTGTFAYKSGRIDTMRDGASGVTQKLGYNAAGLLEKVDYSAGRVRTYGYDDFGRLASDVLKNAANAEVAKIAYRYDLDDHLIGKDTAGTAGAGANTYGYDDAGRMTSWTSGTGTVDYAWDDSGNRIKAGAKTATYDQRNRLLNDSDYTYAYTPRGTMATRTSSGLAETYSFDAFDRLVSSEGQSYVYDGLDRVVSRAGKTFAYAGFEPDPVNDGSERFARGPAGELLAVEDSANNTRITVSDEHDDVVASFDSGSDLSALAASTAFDPYGQRIAQAGTPSNVGYQGDWTDPDTGQVDMGARWYEPGTGTFTSRDTVSYSQGDSILANKYTYGAGDPMSNNDPTGNWPSCGWCKKAVNKVASVASTAWSYTTRAVSYTGSWLASQARAAWSGIKRIGTAIVNTVSAGLRAAGNALRSGWDRYVQPTLKRAQNYAAQKAAEIHRAAVAVQSRAKAAISTAVKSVSLKRIGSAVLANLSSLKMSISAAMPAKLVQSFNSVVQDMGKAANALYKTATAAGGAIVSGIQNAGEWVVDHKAQIIGGIAGAVVGIGCGALIGVTGVGAVACAAAGGAVGSLVTDLIEGGKGWKEMAANALIGGTIGAIMGPLSSVGGSAVTGAVRGLISGGVRNAVSMGSTAAASTFKSFGSTQVGGLVGRALASRGASSAGREALESAGATARSPIRVASGESCPNSFAPATTVVMADGSTKKIEDVKVGDEVLATDPTTGKTEKRAVTALIIGVGEKKMVELTVDIDGDKGDKTASITATDGHPFWVPDLQEWVKASELASGSMLQTGAGSYVQVTKVKAWTAQKQRVHNLTVDGLHTYYVGAASSAVLVHNCRNGGPMDLDHLEDRAQDLQDLIPAGRSNNGATTGLLHATDDLIGPTDFVAVGARKNISGIQRRALMPGELGISVTQKNALDQFKHAEEKLWELAVHLDMTPEGLAVSRPICDACRDFLQQRGATIVGETRAVWKR